MHAGEYVSRRKRKRKKKRKRERKNKKKQKREDEKKNVYGNGGLGFCLPHRVPTSAIYAWLCTALDYIQSDIIFLLPLSILLALLALWAKLFKRNKLITVIYIEIQMITFLNDLIVCYDILFQRHIFRRKQKQFFS